MSAQAKRCAQCGREAPPDLFRCPDCDAWLPAQNPADRLAARLAKALGEGFRLEEQIGRGGCAYVFRVRDLRLDRDLAVKVLLPSLAGSEELAARFRRETRVAAALTHPNIVPIYFLGPDDGLPWFAMPRIHGESLAERLKREGPQPYAVTLGIGRDVAAALDAAHTTGVIHRDVKPANILLELATGRALLTDFGIAKAVSGDSSFRTASGMVVGTPYYVSPEQAAADPAVGARSDVYSLSVVLYEMLAGDPPFKGPTAQALFAAHQAHEPPPLMARRPDLRPGVADTLMAGLAKDPAARPATAGELIARIERAQGRASLRRSGATILSQMSTADPQLYRSAQAAGSSGGLDPQGSLSEWIETVAAAEREVEDAFASGSPERALEAVAGVAQHAGTERPAYRHPIEAALQRMGARADLVEGLIDAWQRGTGRDPAAIEQHLRAILPAARPGLLTVAEQRRDPAIILLLDRLGLLDETAGRAFAEHRSPAVAQAFADALRESARAGAVVEGWLLRLARHESPAVRVAAAASAAARRGAVATVVGRHLIADKQPAVRRAGLGVLGASGRRDAIVDLEGVLKRGVREDKLVALEALAALGLAEAVPPLVGVLRDQPFFGGSGHADLRRAAARALATLPHPAAREALAACRDDKDDEVRAVAREAGQQTFDA